MDKVDDEDMELAAMTTIRGALVPLDDLARGRVLRWANERFKGTASPPQAQRTPPEGRPSGGDTDGGSRRFPDLATLFHTVSPKTESDKVLTVGYWFQQEEAQKDLDSFGINKELKQLGFGVSNVTRAFDTLVATKPALVMQTRKAGTKKQSRKKFRLTDHGIRTVERMLQNGAAGDGQPSDD